MSLTIQDVSIVVIVRNSSPGMLNPDFLRTAGVSGTDWALAAPAVTTEVLSQVRYSNGVAVLAVPDRITFSEQVGATLSAGSSSAPSLRVPGMVERFLRALSFLQCTALGVNVTAYTALPGAEPAAAFVLDRFVTDGPWKGAGAARPSALVRFSYPRPDGVLQVTLDEGKFVAGPGAAPSDVLVVLANYHRDLVPAYGSGSAVDVGAVIPLVARAGDDIAATRTLIIDTILAPETVR